MNYLDKEEAWLLGALQFKQNLRAIEVWKIVIGNREFQKK